MRTVTRIPVLAACVAIVASVTGSVAAMSEQSGTPRVANVDQSSVTTFADEADQGILRVARDSSSYAGAYIDQSRGGMLVILLMDPPPGLVGQLNALAPVAGPGIEYRFAEYSLSELTSAVERVREVWTELDAGAGLLGAHIDEARNSVVISVASADRMAPMASTWAERLGVRVEFEAATPTSDTDCPNRDDCHAPTWAGIRLYKGVIDSQHECALGFHIRVGLDERMITSGHCGYSGSNNWLHPAIAGDHVLGSETGDTPYTDGGQDTMVIQLDDDSETSDNIFACCTDIIGYGTPIQGETLKASLAESDTIKTGTVQWISGWWISDTADPDIDVWGGKLSIATIDGDSGSPVYRETGDNQARAVGLNANAVGNFSRVDNALSAFGAGIVS